MCVKRNILNLKQYDEIKILSETIDKITNSRESFLKRNSSPHRLGRRYFFKLICNSEGNYG